MAATAAPTEPAANPFVILDAPPPRVERAAARHSALMPQIPLEDGQQYRFHFDMSKCVGCKCCEVACAEQNNNPPEISWRRVGEVEGGVFPFTQRLHLSMGCNHCVDPSCMSGCPTDAYTKDAATGIVLHDADVCIGCEYCIWNCPYSVPAFNPERGVVGKCDMCRGRLADGDKPACVDACPSEALAIEVVDIAEWKSKYRGEANAPGLPSADDTISTTRVTLPADMPLNTEKADYHRVRPEKPHYSLVAVTVLTQLSVGGFAGAWLMSLFRSPEGLGPAALLSLALGLASLAAAPLHLGRPAYAPLAVRNFRTSWLSREILGLSSFGLTASIYAAMLLWGAPAAPVVGGLASLIGVFGLYAGARIYLVPGRPAWNSRQTIVDFLLTAATLGPLLLAAVGGGYAFAAPAAASAAVAQLLNQLWRFLRLVRSEEYEKQASARLLSGELARLFLLRLGLPILGAVALPAMGRAVEGFVLTLVAALLGRYLFFVSVVPKNMAMTFFERREAA